MSHPESDIVNKIKAVSEQDVEYVKLLNKIQNNEINLNGKDFKVDEKGLI